jgi:hypothetical protein
MPFAFLSYRARDGEVFATALLARLSEEVPDLEIWQDRFDIQAAAAQLK